MQSAIEALKVHRVDSLKTWVKAAQEVRQAAAEGHDLEPHLEVIRQAYRESHQLPVMVPLAQALVAHYLNRDDLEGLKRELADPEFTPYLFDALAELANRLKVEHFLVLLASGPKDRWLGMVEKFARSQPEQLGRLLQKLWDIEAMRSSFPDLLRDLVIHGVGQVADLSVGVPMLANLLSGPQGDDAAGTLRWLVEADVDLGQAIQPDGRHLTAYAYCYQAARLGHWEKIEACLIDPRSNTRKGAIHALSVRLNSTQQAAEPLACGLIRALSDPEVGLRQAALGGLREAWRVGRSADKIPSHPGAFTPELCEFLYLWMHRNRRRVRQVAEVLPQSNEPHLTRLAHACRSSDHRWDCTICRHLPRKIFCTDFLDLPKNLQRLKPAGSYDRSGDRHCPECSARYTVNYSEENDDMRTRIEVEVVRQPRSELDRALLDHPQAYLRQETAYHLARSGHTQERKMLISHPDPVVCEAALNALSVPVAEDLIQPLRACLAGPPAVRELAGRLLLSSLARSGQTHKLAHLLTSASPEVRTQTLAALVYDKLLDPAPFHEPIHQLLEHADLELRRRAVQGVSWLARRNHRRALQLETLLSHLQNGPEPIRHEAIRSLDELRPQWGKLATRVHAALTRALQQDPQTRYPLLELLREIGAKRADLNTLVKLLLEEKNDQAGVILREALERNPKHPQLVKRLAPGWELPESLRYEVSLCYQLMLKAGLDLGPVSRPIMDALSAPNSGYVEGYFSQPWARFLTAQPAPDPELLRRLLLAAPDVSGGTSQVLAERAAQGMDLTPLIPTLETLTQNRHWYTADYARKALEAIQRGKL